jgi:hypothetical protein
MEELAAWLVDTLICMGAKIIALGLKQVCGKPRGAETVIER